LTYESLLNDLQTSYTWFYGLFRQFLNLISGYPIIMLGLFFTITLPVFYLLFDFFGNLSDAPGDMTKEGFRIYKLIKHREEKIKKTAEREAFKREKANQHMRAYEIAQTFFANNPEVMSISIMGHKFFQDGFEHKNWSDERRKARRNRFAYHSFEPVNSSSASPQRSRANIDVEVDDD